MDLARLAVQREGDALVEELKEKIMRAVVYLANERRMRTQKESFMTKFNS